MISQMTPSTPRLFASSMSFTIERQKQKLRRHPQLIIGTPGRLLDHLRRQTIDLSQVNKVVLDEADECWLTVRPGSFKLGQDDNDLDSAAAAPSGTGIGFKADGVFYEMTPTPEQEAPWKAAGVDEYVNVRANNFALNHKMLEMLGAIAK